MKKRMKNLLSLALAAVLCMPTATVPVFGAPVKDADVEVSMVASTKAASLLTTDDQLEEIDKMGSLPAKFDLREA